jgi:hypothetical protein
MEKPKQLEDQEIDLKKLKEICQEYADFVDNNEEYHEDNDYDQYVFEVAMETIFGEKFFDWHNKQLENK